MRCIWLLYYDCFCDPNSDDADGRYFAGSYPNVPSIGTTEWWVHCLGSHFASPKSEICFITFYEITSCWFNFTDIQTFFFLHSGYYWTDSFVLWLEEALLFNPKNRFTWGSKSSPRTTLDAFMSRWMIRCLQNMCRYCKPLATPTAIFCLKDHSRTFPVFPEKCDLPFSHCYWQKSSALFWNKTTD